MPKIHFVKEGDLAALAKHVRIKTGKRKAHIAEELGVHRPTIQLAEENPEQSLTKLRIRIIEKYSKQRITGPYYRVTER